VGGEHDVRVGVVGMGGVDVESVAFYRNLSRLVSNAAEFAIKVIAYGGFVAGDGFNVDELARERDGVHGGEDSKIRRQGSGDRRQDDGHSGFGPWTSPLVSSLPHRSFWLGSSIRGPRPSLV